MELTEKQQAAFELLTQREQAFALLYLERPVHGMTLAQCYTAAGYTAKNDNVANVSAYQLIRRPKLWTFTKLMRDEALASTALTLEFLDAQLAELIVASAADVMTTVAFETGREDAETGLPIIRHVPMLRCAIDDLPPEIQGAIQSIKTTKEGVEVKMYSRIDAMKLAMQRLNGLKETHEHTGSIDVQGLTDEQLNTRIAQLIGSRSAGTSED